MGVPKYRLRLGEETLLQRICRIVAEATSQVVISAAPGQDLSELRERWPIIRDDRPGSGPLEALATVLQESAGSLIPAAACVFIVSCDTPLLNPHVIRFLASQMAGNVDAVVIDDGSRLHPFCAVYRLEAALSAAKHLLDQQVRRLTALPESLSIRRVPTAELTLIDPGLDCLLNCNTPEDYQQLLLRYAELC